MDKVSFSIQHKGHVIRGCFLGVDGESPPRQYHIAIDGYYVGTLIIKGGQWSMDGIWGEVLSEVLGNYIELWWQ